MAGLDVPLAGRAAPRTLPGSMQVRFCDEFEHGFGWIAEELLVRTSHALVVDGRVWLLDPVDGEGVEERVRSAGEPAGVIQLLDRHGRDSAALARRLGVPHHVVPRHRLDAAPFEFLRVRNWRVWREVALWWPEARVLASADALVTVSAYRAPGERLSLHPLVRPFPPWRALEGIEPLHVLCGHGEGVHGGEATPALEHALANARRGLPRAWLNAGRALAKSR